VAFPSVVDLALRVNKLGQSSVTYEVAIFEKHAEDVKAVGVFTHVFVEREKDRPAAEGMPQRSRDGLTKLLHKRLAKL